MVSVVALAFALTLDGIGSRGDVDPGRERIPVSAWATYPAYGIAFVLVAAVADRQFAFGWSLLMPAVVGVALLALSTRLRLARAPEACLAGLIALQLAACLVVWTVIPDDDSAVGLVLFALATLVGERLIPLGGKLRQYPESLDTTRLALVGLSATTAMIAIYVSGLFGALWATAGWSVLAGAVMTMGFLLKSSRHRGVALAVLGACLLRVFLVDTRGLTDTAQTAAFLVLGLCLVGAAWLYSRHSEELKDWL